MRMLLILLFCASLALAQESSQPNVAVLAFTGDNTVNTDQLRFITQKFTGELIDSKVFRVLDRGKMDFVLQEQGFQQSGACNSSECKVQMGQLLGVDKLVSGSLVRFGNSYAMHLEYIDVGTGEIENTVDVKESGELEEVYELLCQNASRKLALNIKKQREQKPLSPEIGIQPSGKDSSTETVADKHQYVPVDAIPKGESKPLSTKRKVALAVWGTSIVAVGGGFYFNQQGESSQDDYDAAIRAENAEETKSAYEDTQVADRNRNVSYGISIGSFVVGAVLWFWPED